MAYATRLKPSSIEKIKTNARIKMRDRWHLRKSLGVCQACGREKGPDSTITRCRPCLESQRRQYIFRTFGITAEDYDRLLLEQNGVCAICKGAPSAGKRYLSVDHDHETGNVRGLLCFNCNAGLGHLGDTQAKIQNVLAYLTRVASYERSGG